MLDSMTRDDLLAQIRQLPRDEQIELAHDLWDEIDPTGDLLPDWAKEELDRCLEDTPENVANIPWEEACKRLGIPPK
jgi:putative addiction module component (TIGR02574 family)